MSDMIPKVEATRRQFLKASAATAALLTLGDELFKGSAPGMFERVTATSRDARQDEWLHSYCRMCQAPGCATLIRVVDGVAVELKGDPSCPTNAGTLCGRGLGAIMSLYNPYRVKTPMKRTNPNKDLEEDPEWVEISWDEALNIVADRLNTIRAKDPRRVVINTGFGSFTDYHREILSGFAESFGIPAGNLLPTNGPLCSTHIAVMMTQGGMHVCEPDFQYCNYLVTLGSSVGANWATASGPVRGLMEAVERGMKLVVVDPRCGKEASLGEWVPIRPGSELALELALLHVMLYEIGLEKLDSTFLKNRSNAPYLIGAGERYTRDPETNKPIIWDPVDDKAKVFDDPSIQDYALEGEFEVAGETVHPGFELIKREMQSYTPEWAQPITSISASTLRRIAHEFVEAAQVGSNVVLDGMEFPLRPAMVWPKRGALSQADGAYVHFASKMIQGLVGALDVPGGDLGSGWGPPFDLKPNEDGVVTPRMEAVGHPFKFPPDDVQLSSFYPLRHYVPHVAWRAILDPEKYYLPYEVEALIIYGGNSIINNAAPDEPVAAFKKIPFIASIAYHFDEPAEMSDILLPESSNLEREMMIMPGTGGKGRFAPLMPSGTMYRFPVVPLIYNTKQGDEILLELAHRLDLLGGENGLNAQLNRSLRFNEEYALKSEEVATLSEIIDRRLKSRYGPGKGVDYFREVGHEFELVGPKTTYNYAYYPMGETRYHFFWEHLKAVGDRLAEGCNEFGVTVPGWDMADLLDHYRPIPHWRPMPIHKEPMEYDMWFVNWKTPFVLFGLGGNVENPWLNEISTSTDPYQMALCMNPAAAAQKGIGDGDLVEVESQWGKLTGRVKLSELFHPEVIGTPGNYGRRSIHMNPIALAGPNYNQLLSPDDGTFCPVNTCIVISPRVKVRRLEG